MDVIVVFNQVATLFIILFIGFIAKKVGIINKAVNKKLSEFLLMVTAPMLIFTSFFMEYEKEKLLNALYVVGLAIVMFVISIIIAEKIFYTKQPKDKRAVIKSAIVFSNCGFMGFPLVDSIFGQEGVFYASMYVVVFNIVLWTYGVVIFSGRADFKIKKALISPAMIAVYLGIPIFLLQIKMPFPIENAAQMVGSMTTPLAMIIIGSIIADANLKNALSGIQVYTLSIIRLIIMPMIAYFLVMIVDIPKAASDICIVVLAMPVAVNAAVFSEKFETEPLFASKAVTVSTLLSIFTIPIILMLL
ncbi:AEC family transporter [Herbivorax sp. ANBcel31]|uniref:AEC family transporter n=1 Tax=Herbivorax sp. ANBcel31 TaxID=3069754 RepID=UPI0027B106D0|nr:AEC family transporter [Herbivorax sp. ANBcel31]MDQ2086974.1 AEC family transporter [Herbivorax sp. ANBcel31]